MTEPDADRPAGADLCAWIGRREQVRDLVTAAPVAALAATLDHPPREVCDGDPLPPLWHWLYFLPHPRASELGEDGHARRGGFLPPVALPRRMWAGSRFEFGARPLRVGQRIERESTVEDVKHRRGRSGALVFVTVHHEIRAEGAAEPALREWHHIVYREAPGPGDAAPSPTPSPMAPQWRRLVRPDAVLLFRYSALTFNGHRIHYDRTFANGVEGYPGLVVHGPLLATLLLDLLREHRRDAALDTFEFRALRPLFDGAAFTLAGADAGDAGVRLWVLDAGGAVAMDAQATLRPFGPG